MALFQRSNSTDSLERWHRPSFSSGDQRKFSFNPIDDPPAATPPETSQPLDANALSAYEVSRTKRILQVVVAALYCLLAAGPVFGFAAIKPVLVDQGVYRDKCTKQELTDDVWVCYGQELRLNLMFTVAAVSTNICALPVGTILDRYGPRVASLVGVFFLFLGTLAMAFAAELPFDAYIPGYLFLALGGPFIFISAFQLSNTFPTHSGLILAFLTGAFDTSSVIFLIYRLIYQSTQGRFTPKAFFLVYLIVPVLILLAQIFIMPAKTYKTVDEIIQTAPDPTDDIHDSDSEIDDQQRRTSIQNTRREHRESIASEITALLGTKDAQQQMAESDAKTKRSGVWGALHGRTAQQQIFSPWFFLITLFTVVQMLRINYFIATVRTQYTTLLGSADAAQHINEVFDVLLPVGGVVAVPFIGLLLDRTSTPVVLASLVFFATLIGALGVIPSVPAAYAAIACFVVYRPLYYTAISDYAAKVFGFQTFGKVYGLIICLAGLFNFAQAGLDALTHHVFDNDPVPVDLILLAAAFVVGCALVGFVWRKSVVLQRELLEQEAEAAREVEIPVSLPNGEEQGGAQRRNGYGAA